VNLPCLRFSVLDFGSLARVRLFRSAQVSLWAAVFLLTAFSVRGAVTPSQLVCEYQVNPLGIDTANPRLGWKFTADAGTPRGWLQSAYEIQAASSAANLSGNVADLWDSGEVKSSQNTFVPYAGTALTTSKQVFWRVRIWDQNSNVSAWSATASWTMGLLATTDWKGSWIMMPTVNGASYPNTASSRTGTATAPQSVMARKDFTVKAGLTRATLSFCGLGCYEFSLNGAKVGQSFFPPGWTLYSKTCLYDTYDVTSMLTTGSNTAGFILGNGMYNIVGGRYTKLTQSFGEKKAIGQLRLEYSDGSVVFVPTDATWKINPGPLTFSCVYGGEDEDKRLEPAGWNQPGYSATGWSTPLVTTGPGGVLKGLSGAAPPIQAFQTLQPVNTTVLGTGNVVYDLGQNSSLLPQITVSGPAGSYVTITPGELANSDGSVNLTDGTPSFWTYTLAGTSGGETWLPRFFYRGCRYLQVQSYAAPAGGALPVVSSLQGVVIHSASASVGTFSCSNTLFNQTSSLIQWSQISNMESIFTDCPTREKLGWLEETHLNGPSLRYNYDLGQMYTKMFADILDSQVSGGEVPTTAPDYLGSGGDFGDSPEWGSSLFQSAWQQYQFNGDTGPLTAAYPAMKSYLAWLGTQASGNVLLFGLGDWYDLGPAAPGNEQLTPLGVTATSIYYSDAVITSQVATLLGKTADATTYQQLAAQIQSSFNTEFLNSSYGDYANLAPSLTNPLLGSQTANAMPLALNMVPSAQVSSVLAAIVQDITNHGGNLTSGEVGYRFLLRALADNGRSDVIYTMNNQSTNPGYGYMISHGATSLLESWTANTSDSQIHYMLGQINEWFYHDLAGIQSDPTGPGFKKIIIKPAPVGNLTSVNATYNSIQGAITSNWTNGPSGLAMTVTIPVGTTATVYVPASSPSVVTESGVLASSSPGVTYLGLSSGAAMYAVGSGTYSFTSSNQPAAPTSLTAVAAGQQVNLSWVPSANATSYTVMRSTSGNSGYVTLASNLISPAYADTALTYGTTYYYEVYAVNSTGVSIPSLPTSATPQNIQDPGFETPVVTGYAYDPTSSAWTFSGQSGISANGSGFTGNNPNAPGGSQVAFVQSLGTMSQTFQGLITGATYSVTFMAAQRSGTNGGGETWQVLIGSSVIGSFAPPESATSYTSYSANFVATGATQTLTFAGTDTKGGDNTIFIDNIQMSLVSPLVASPGNGLATLVWPTSAGASAYRIQRATTSGGPYATVIGSTPGSSYVDTGLNNGTTYYYVITPLVNGVAGTTSAPSAVTPSSSTTFLVRSTGGNGTGTTLSTDSSTESPVQAFDQTTSTKWYTGASPTPSQPVILQYQFGNNLAWAVTQYQISSANDVPQRDPAAWQLAGSNDLVNWTTLDTQTGQVFANRNTAATYSFSNSTPYRYYELLITANNGGSSYGLQLSEFALLSAPTDPGDKTPPVLTVPPNISVNTTNSSGTAVTFSVTANDAVSGPLAPVCTPASGSVFASGTTTVSCSATDLAGNAAVANFTITVNVLSAYQQWLLANNLPLSTADAATPDGDGVPILLKYATGMTPGTMSAAGPATIGNGGNYLTFSFNRLNPAPSALSYIVEASSDLVTWSSIATLAAGAPSWTGSATVTETGTNPVSVTVADSVAYTPSSPRFLHLRVTTATDTTVPGTVPQGDVPLSPAPSSTSASSLTLDNAPEARGTVQARTTGTLTVASAGNWSTTGSPYAVRLLSGGGSGATFVITGQSGNVLTLATNGVDLTHLVAVGDTYEVMPLETLSSLFGTTSVPFQTGTSALTADTIQFWNGTSWLAYYSNGTNWKQAGSLLSQNNTVIPPGAGWLNLRQGSSAFTLYVVGCVPEVAMREFVPTGVSFVAGASPLPSTLSATGFAAATGWLKGASAIVADNVLTWNGTAWGTFYNNGTNWKQAGSLLNQNNTALPAGQPFFVVRQSSVTPNQALIVQPLNYTP
jgi:alpha-L-rhamnosidase